MVSHLDSTTNILLYLLYHIYVYIHFVVHPSIHLIFLMYFKVNYRCQTFPKKFSSI